MGFSILLQSREARPTTAESTAVTTLRERLSKLVTHLKRLTVRVEEMNDLVRGEEHVCRVTVAPSRKLGGPSFVVEGRAPTLRQAVDLAGDAISGEISRAVELAAMPARRRARKGSEPELKPESTMTLSRRARTSNRISVRPEREGAIEIEAENPGTEMSANPQRGRHFHMTRHQSRATSARELSATRPSRKSTRKSANRSKRDSNLARRTQRAVHSPESRAASRGA